MTTPLANFTLPFEKNDDERTCASKLRNVMVPYIEFDEKQEMKTYRIQEWDNPNVRIRAPNIVCAVAKLFVKVPNSEDLLYFYADLLSDIHEDIEEGVYKLEVERQRFEKIIPKEYQLAQDFVDTLPFDVLFLVAQMTSDEVENEHRIVKDTGVFEYV